jgi:hypothetical protein
MAELLPKTSIDDGKSPFSDFNIVKQEEEERIKNPT